MVHLVERNPCLLETARIKRDDGSRGRRSLSREGRQDLAPSLLSGLGPVCVSSVCADMCPACQRASITAISPV